MKVGLSEAARLTGRNQSTIHRAMKDGRLPHIKSGDSRSVDTDDLERVFGTKPKSKRIVITITLEIEETD